MHGSPRILVVEDEPFIAQVLSDVLAAEGDTVDTASNGRLALEMIEARAYDLILTDLQMPELDGIGLCRDLEGRRPELLRRLIIISGTIEHPDYEQSLAHIDVPVLEKPFSLSALHAVMQQVLAGHESGRPG